MRNIPDFKPTQHPKAAEWDKAHGYNAETYKKMPIPENRPCDRCGKVAKKGYTHVECAQKWLDEALNPDYVYQN